MNIPILRLGREYTSYDRVELDLPLAVSRKAG